MGGSDEPTPLDNGHINKMAMITGEHIKAARKLLG
jgi:hypothetical protein